MPLQLAACAIQGPRPSSAGNILFVEGGGLEGPSALLHPNRSLALPLNNPPLPTTTIYPLSFSSYSLRSRKARTPHTYTSSNLMERHVHSPSFFNAFSHLFRRGQSSSRSPPADERVDFVPQLSGVLDSRFHSSEQTEPVYSLPL